MRSVLTGSSLLLLIAVGCGRVRYREVDAPHDASPTSIDAFTSDASSAVDAPEDAQRTDVRTDAFSSTDTFVVDAGNDAGAPDAALPIGMYNVIFLTPLLPNANFGGLAGADALCSRYAREGGFGGTFVAYLSTSTVNAIDRLGTAQGWVRPDGLPVARSQADLSARGDLLYPPSVDHLGTRNPAGYTVLTGTGLDGRVATGQTCSDWMSTSGSGTGGIWDMASWDWHARSGASCNAATHLYCMQTDHNRAPPVTLVSGRHIFAVYRPTATETPDAACTRLGASLPGTYRALVATTGASAASRFTLDRWPWVNTQGLVVAESMADLTTNGLWSSVRQVDGSSAAFSMLAAGASDMFTPSTASCSNWTSVSASETTAVSLVGYSAQHWFSSSNAACNNLMWFYCLEE